MSAFDLAEGHRHWKVNTGNDRPGDPVVAGDSVVVPFNGAISSSSDQDIRPSVRAYSLEDGKEQWSIKPPERANDAAVGGETVAVVSSGGWNETSVVLGVDLADSTEQWRTETPGTASPNPVVANGAVYVASHGGYLRALDLTDGSERWQRDFESRPVGIAVDGDTMYVAANSSVSALATSDGSVDWQFTPDSEESKVHTVAAGTDAVYAGARGDEAPLVALDADDGRKRWYHRFPNTTVEGDQLKSGVESQPVVADGGLYVNAFGGLYAFGPAE